MLVLSSSLDREVQAHKHFTGATNIYWLNELMRYVRSEGLLDNFRLYPMVARTNYGTGTTVRGLGRLTGNQMTLVNGPSWGASGLEFVSASSQYGAIADFLGSETLTVWARVTKTDNLTGTQGIVAQYDTGSNLRSWLLAKDGTIAGDPFAILRSADGTFANGERFDDGKPGIGSDTVYAAQWVNSGDRFFWADNVLQSLTLGAGTAQTTRLNSSANITFAAFLSGGAPTGFADMTAHATAFLTGSVTTTQRETITDLINAL